MDAKKLHEVQHLVSLYCDGELDPAGVQRLSQMLASDPQAVEAYLDLTTTHSDLTLLNSGVTQPSGDSMAETSAADLGAAFGAEDLKSSKPARGNVGRRGSGS